MRALGFRPLALDWLTEEQATLDPTPSHSLGVCNVVWFVAMLIFRRCLLLVFISNDIATLYPVVADRRATARTTETLNHAAFRQKKLIWHSLRSTSWVPAGCCRSSRLRRGPRDENHGFVESQGLSCGEKGSRLWNSEGFETVHGLCPILFEPDAYLTEPKTGHSREKCSGRSFSVESRLVVETKAAKCTCVTVSLLES